MLSGQVIWRADTPLRLPFSVPDNSAVRCVQEEYQALLRDVGVPNTRLLRSSVLQMSLKPGAGDIVWSCTRSTVLKAALVLL